MSAQRGANAHVAHDGAGYAGREPFGRRVAAGAVLFEDALAVILLLTGLLLNSGLAGRRDYRRVVLLCGNCER